MKEKPNQNKVKLLIGIIAAVITVIVVITIYVVSMLPPSSSSLNIKAITGNTAITTNLVTGQNTSRYTVTMVYKDGCPYCESARKTIEHELSEHNKDVVQFSQIDGTTPNGKKLLKQFNAKGVPLIIVTDTYLNKSHSVNDSDAKGIKYLLNKYAFVK